MNENKYNKKFKNAKTQVERDEINRIFEKSIHNRRLFRKFLNSFKNALPILDFIVAIIALIVALIK